MTQIGVLALAAALALVAGPRSESGRLAALVGAGRLRAPRARRRTGRSWRIVPSWSLALGAAAACGGSVTVLAGAALGCAAALASATCGGLAVTGHARRCRQARRVALASAVRVLVGEVRAGSRPAPALLAAAAASPAHGQAFTVAARVAETGGEIGEVLVGAGPDLAPVGQAWDVAAQTGAPLADVLDRVADDLTAAQSRHRAVQVALAGPRSSAALLALLPIVGVCLGWALGADPLATLLGSPAGRWLCGVGVFLDAVGVLWTERLAYRAESP